MGDVRLRVAQFLANLWQGPARQSMASTPAGRPRVLPTTDFHRRCSAVPRRNEGGASGGTVAAIRYTVATGCSWPMRQALHDLHRIVSRTLAYRLLTLLLVGGYAVVALVPGQLLG
jgi:hypothetical protein